MNSELILIDSLKRVSGTSTNFNFKVNRSIRDVKRVELVHCSLYNTFFNFSQTNFLIVQEVNNVGHLFSIVWENKSYTIDELVLFLNTKFNEGAGQGTYTIVYDPSDFKLKFNNNTVPFSMKFVQQYSPNQQLGFAKQNTAFLTYHQSPNTIDLNSTDYILVNLDRLGTVVTANKTSGSFYIPLMNSNRGGINIYDSNSQFIQYIECNNAELSDMQITIINDKDEIAISDEINLKILLRYYY